MKHNWEIKKLEDIADINYGTRIVQKVSGGFIYPVYGGGGATFKSDDYNREDCLIVSRFAMSKQCTRRVVGKFFLNDSGLTIVPKNNSILQSFLDVQIIGLNDKIYSLGKGAAQRNLDIKELKKLKISFPKSIETQQTIVKELDLLSTLINKQKAQLTELDRLAQSVFYDMFGDPVENEKGWEVKSVIDETTCIVPGRDKPKSFTGTIPWVTTADLNHLGYTFKSRLFLSEEEIAEVRAKKIPIGSVVMTCVGDLGVVSIAANEMIINQQLHAFICGEKINNYFLAYNLSCRKDYMYKMASNTTVPYMNKTICNSIPIILPPLSLQQQFAEKIEAIEAQKALVKQSIAQSEQLLASRMQYYFQ